MYLAAQTPAPKEGLIRHQESTTAGVTQCVKPGVSCLLFMQVVPVLCSETGKTLAGKTFSQVVPAMKQKWATFSPRGKKIANLGKPLAGNLFPKLSHKVGKLGKRLLVGKGVELGSQMALGSFKHLEKEQQHGEG